jgi:hypothetical protein
MKAVRIFDGELDYNRRNPRMSYYMDKKLRMRDASNGVWELDSMQLEHDFSWRDMLRLGRSLQSRLEI